MEDLKALLLMPLLVIFVICAVILSVSALRNKVLFKMGARNIPRRLANTVLTCLGLMFAAMIFSASFATGDTLNHSIRGLAVDYLGKVDIMVMRDGVDFGAVQGHALTGAETTNYFDEAEADNVRSTLTELMDTGTVEGVAPAIIENVPGVSQNKLNEPSITLLGFDHQHMEGFDLLVDERGQELSLEELEGLGEGYIYINMDLAESLEIGINDQIDIFLSREETPLTVAGIYETGGNPSTFSFDAGATAVMALSQLQSLRGSDEINYVIITNQGGAIEGAEHTDAVMQILEPTFEGTGLKVEPVKQDALDEADEGGAMFSTIFLVLGSFSMIAGILLIFLIFVMLAAERKQELGIARAIGTQRGHIIRLFTFEGVIYALIASAVGAGLGLLISWGGIQALASAFKEMGFKIEFDFTTSGVIISYLMGVLFTLLIVVASAWRVSRLNIICAIKDIPEPPQEGKRNIKGLLVVIFFPLLGLPLVFIGIQATEWVPYSLGMSFLIIGLCMLARKRPIRLPDRPAFTLAGTLLVFFWLLPSRFHPKGEEMGAGFEMFILTGVMLVMGSVWVIMYNSDLLLKAIMAIFGRMRSITPMIKTAVSYPMASRFRTGMAVAMFSLIIFTLVYMSSMIASFNGLLDDTDRVTGGFDIRSTVSFTNPITDIETELQGADGVSLNDFQAIGSFNFIRTKMRDASGTPEEIPAATQSENPNDATPEEEWTDLFIEGVDSDYTENVNYDFELTTADYVSKEEVWEALSKDSSLAVVSTEIAPTKYTPMGGSEFDLVIGEGEFVVEDEVLPDNIFVEVQTYGLNPETRKLQVIGVVDGMAVYSGLVTASQETVNDLAGNGNIILPNRYRFMVEPEKADEVPQLAKSLEKHFAENGMNAEVMSEEVEDFAKIQNMFLNLMIAFMALGLIVGIAALGVIAARSVVERRQQVGMLRAIGFQQGMIQFTFLLESSFIAFLGILLGVGLGVVTSILFMGEADVEGLKVIIPIDRIVMIVVLTYVASLFTTFLPAYQAARIYPAEALRYE
ncbi:MAG: FtsX-like permease family protein [Chloroflexi bacterium]|jgi:putative ABC transport system permease protein|nr:FtsX-like permease family protein [Chloroflexota bacterium]